MEWTYLCLLIPAVLVPVVLLFGFSGCDLVFKLDPVPPSSPPTTPVMLVGKVVSGSSVSLSWQNTDPSAVRYQVNRAPVNGSFEIVSDQVTAQSFVDTGLTEGETYTYFVNAINSSDQLSDESNTATVALVFRTAFAAALTDDETGLRGYTVVQTIKAHDFADPANPGNLANETGTILRLSIRGSLNGLLKIDKIFVSRVAGPTSGNTIPDPWDSAADLTLVAANVTLAAGTAKTLDTAVYLLDPTRDLLFAFDINNTQGAGNLRFASISGPAAYRREATTEAGVGDRQPDYEQLPDQLYLIEKIEVL